MVVMSKIWRFGTTIFFCCPIKWVVAVSISHSYLQMLWGSSIVGITKRISFWKMGHIKMIDLAIAV